MAIRWQCCFRPVRMPTPAISCPCWSRSACQAAKVVHANAAGMSWPTRAMTARRCVSTATGMACSRSFLCARCIANLDVVCHDCSTSPGIASVTSLSGYSAGSRKSAVYAPATTSWQAVSEPWLCWLASRNACVRTFQTNPSSACDLASSNTCAVARIEVARAGECGRVNSSMAFATNRRWGSAAPRSAPSRPAHGACSPAGRAGSGCAGCASSGPDAGRRGSRGRR